MVVLDLLTLLVEDGSDVSQRLVIREPNHPITKDLPTEFMHVDDELYGWLRGPAKNLTVLASVRD